MACIISREPYIFSYLDSVDFLRCFFGKILSYMSPVVTGDKNCVLNFVSRLLCNDYFAAGSEDRVVCFSCGLTLYRWEDDDIPLKEHRRWQPRCVFFLQRAFPQLLYFGCKYLYTPKISIVPAWHISSFFPHKMAVFVCIHGVNCILNTVR